MTKQEIEKAIKNGESVWYADTYNRKVWEINLSEKYKPEIYLDGILYVYENINDRFKQELFVEDLHKTRAEAEHYLYHKNVTRTETLPFLTWEEFLEQCSLTFYSQSHEWFTMYWDDIDGIVIESIDYAKRKTWDLTEANFYKAYDECVMLFKEKEDEWCFKN